MFTDFDCKNDQNLTISHNSPLILDQCFTVGAKWHFGGSGPLVIACRCHYCVVGGCITKCVRQSQTLHMSPSQPLASTNLFWTVTEVTERVALTFNLTSSILSHLTEARNVSNNNTTAISATWNTYATDGRTCRLSKQHGIYSLRQVDWYQVNIVRFTCFLQNSTTTARKIYKSKITWLQTWEIHESQCYTFLVYKIHCTTLHNSFFIVA